MDTVIKLYNPKDAPFGQLSNNALYPIVINGKRWNTVTNYIFSNLLITPEYKSILQYADISKDSKRNLADKTRAIIENIQESTGARLTTEDKKRIKKGTSVQKMDIHTMYRHYADQEYLENVRTSLEKAYNARISDNPEIMQTLLETENFPILYVSDNPSLGTGDDGRGYNLVGKTLMQIRHNIRLRLNEQNRKTEKETLDDQIFTAYKAFMILQHELSKGNDLCKCLKKTARQVLEESPGLLEETKVSESSKPTIIQMYNRGLFPIINEELKNPGSMVVTMRKKGLPVLKQKAEISRVNIIINLYTQYTILQMNPSWDSQKIREASNQLFDSLLQNTPNATEESVATKFTEFKNRIVSLYNDNKLPQDLSEKIAKKLKKIYIPKDEESQEEENGSLRGSSEDSQSLQSSSPQEEEKSTPNEESDSEQTDSSSSVDLTDPIAKLFTSDEKARKIFLLEKLEDYTGINMIKKYKKWSNARLEKELLQYEGPEAAGPYKEPTEGVGEWVAKAKFPNNKTEHLQNFPTRPSPKDIQKLVKKYNSKNTKQITTRQILVNWTPHKKSKHITIDEEKNTFQEANLPDGFVKEFGPSVQISSVVEENEEELRPFCPIYEKIVTIQDEKGQDQTVKENLMIDGLTYPNISIYITTKLLTHTGKHKDAYNVLSKGTPISIARDMLIRDEDFINPSEADELYEKTRDMSENELKEIFARISMLEKFKDINLKILLLLTNNSELVWDNPADLFLGYDTDSQSGTNVTGQILMELRHWFRTDEDQKVHFPEINKNDLEKFLNKDPFIISWINMRVNDMCKTVYKFKQYLYNTTEQEEDIDKDFVTFILDKVLQPCSYIIAFSKVIDIAVPEFFTNIISDAKGLSITIDPSYKEESDRIKEEMKRAVQKYGNVTEKRPFEPRKEFDVIEFSKRQAEELKNFLQSKPTEEQLKEFYAKQQKKSDKALFNKRIEYMTTPKPVYDKLDMSQRLQITNQIQELEEELEIKPSRKLLKKISKLKKSLQAKELGIEDTLRQEWTQIFAEINKPEMSPEEISEKIIELENKQREESENPDILIRPSEEALKTQLETESKKIRDTVTMTEEDADKQLEKLRKAEEEWDEDEYIQNRLAENPRLPEETLKYEIQSRLADIRQRRDNLEKLKAKASEADTRIEALASKYNKIIKKLKKHPERTNPFYVSEKIDLEKTQEEERENLMDEILRKKLSEKERNKKLGELTEKQNQDRLAYYGLQPVKKSRDETAKYQKEMDNYKEQLLRINQKVKSIVRERTDVIERIAEVYWTRIVAMIFFLVDHIKDANEQDIRKVIASVEMLNSNSKTCEFSHDNNTAALTDETDNCIASAIANLLVGIQTFKSQYGEDIPFDTPDIDLAVSIILNKDVSDEKIGDKPEDVLSNVGDDVLDEFERESSEVSELDNNDYDDELVSENEERSGSAEFGMGKKKLAKVNMGIEGVKIILRSIAGKDIRNLDSLARYFMNTITTIKTYKMSDRVKQNRINFFATIR
jgi:predicted NAD-dependent protein-ADP-ribosyltransferase YbiA (DUF1768 family)